MRNAFYLLIACAFAGLMACGDEDEPIVIPQTPEIDYPAPLDTTFRGGELSDNPDPWLHLFVIDKDSNNLFDGDYQRTGILREGMIGIRKVYPPEDYPFLKKGDSPAIESEPNRASIDPGIAPYANHFTETGDSLTYSVLWFGQHRETRVPLKEFRMKLVVEWTNLDTDTLALRYVDDCGARLYEIRLQGDSIGQNTAILVK